ncbi:MAG: terminase gpA endonuclease subunit [Burkholderiaceae bacterium]
MSAKATAIPGIYNPDITPWVKGIHEALDDPKVFEVVCCKSAQVAWTDGVLLNYIGRRIDLDPCPMIIMFAKEQAAKEFNSEKFEPMVEATPRLAAKIDVASTRDKKNRWQFKTFAGGFLKFVGSNSPSSVKSTPAPVTAVEEPDDCNDNVRDQGDTITLLRERGKTYARRKMIFGGTPTVEGVSRIDAAYKGSDQRKFYVACPGCEERQVLSWDNVRWTDNPEAKHEVYGAAQPNTARYCCPHCGSLWTDAEKNRAARKGHWRANAEFHGVAGFYINELYAPFPGSAMPRLVEKYLTAMHALGLGDDTKMRSFRNNTEGLAYAVQSDIPPADDLKLRAESYEEYTVPHGGLLLTVGVDVQHDRLAVVIRAWGRGEESWLVYFGEIFGSTLNPAGGAWVDLDALLTREFVHANGAKLRVAAVSIDGSDGNRTEIVHAYVRLRRHLRYMSVKGASEQTDDRREIFATPKKVDTGKGFKVAKRGFETFIVGTTRAKDLILENRVKLTGSGPGRMHWYQRVRPDYWEQLTSEVKAPSRVNRNRKVWQKKAGVRNEGLDGEVYCLHAARSLKTNLMHEAHWLAIEQRLRQRTLLAEPEPEVEEQDEDEPDSSPPAVNASGNPPEATQEASGAAADMPPPAPLEVQAPAPQPVKRPAPRRAGRTGGFSINKW